ncbi:MAG TPA: hypothetical protein VG273_21885 [Bryobacteraceae bacterium]|nr:hypothetical protein [Bryobacteraceae bacterium]
MRASTNKSTLIEITPRGNVELLLAADREALLKLLRSRGPLRVDRAGRAVLMTQLGASNHVIETAVDMLVRLGLAVVGNHVLRLVEDRQSPE